MLCLGRTEKNFTLEKKVSNAPCWPPKVFSVWGGAFFFLKKNHWKKKVIFDKKNLLKKNSGNRGKGFLIPFDFLPWKTRFPPPIKRKFFFGWSPKNFFFLPWIVVLF